MRICLACNKSFSRPDWLCPNCQHQPTRISGFIALAPNQAVSGEGFRPEYFEELARLEARNFWFTERNHLILDMTRRYFLKIDNYLEIGCGTGFVLSAIAAAYPNASLTGTEMFSDGLQYAARRAPKAELMQVDARRIPFVNEFDLVGAYDVLEHILEDALVLRQIYQSVKPGGGLVITVPQHAWLWSQSDEIACHVRRYSSIELSKKVTDAGFQILDARSFVSLLLPVMWLSRRLRRGTALSSDPLAELRIHPLLNRLLVMIMRVERAAMRFGIRFPAGGSLLIVAMKP